MKTLDALLLVIFLLSLAGMARAQLTTPGPFIAPSPPIGWLPIMGSTGVPSLGACGVGASLSANAQDWGGFINVGTGIVASCRLNFSQSMPTAPNCQVTPSGLAVIVSTPPADAAGFTSTAAVTLATGKLTYQCFPPNGPNQ